MHLLQSAIYYQAPDHGIVTPYTIAENTEVVEIITGGEVYFTDLNGEERCYRRGTIFWHISGEKTIYKTTPQAPYRCLALRFAVDTHQRIVPRVGEWLKLDELDDIGSELIRLFTAGGDCVYLGAYAYGLLLRQYCEPENARQNVFPPALNNILTKIESRQGTVFQLDELQKSSPLQQAQMFRLFRKYLHTTPKKYIRKLALDHAKFLLLSTTLSIKEIAAECGFQYPEVFIKIFKQTENTTPGAFRKLHHQPYQEQGKLC